MVQGSLYPKLDILGKNSPFLCKNRKKLENICRIYIQGSNGVQICTRVVHDLMKDISNDSRLNMSQIRHFRAK